MDKYSKTLGFGLKICGVPKTNNHFHTPKQVRMVLPEKKRHLRIQVFNVCYKMLCLLQIKEIK